VSITTRSVAYETVPDRCPHCGKRMIVDLGADYFGNPGGPAGCLDCGTPPEHGDWAIGLRAALRTVIAARSTT
jgi:hypothetical protein